MALFTIFIIPELHIMKNVAIAALSVIVALMTFLHFTKNHDEAIATFQSLEQGFERDEREMRKKTKELGEYQLLIYPKHSQEKIKNYYDRYVVIQKQCDSLITFINYIKDTLKTYDARVNNSSAAVKELLVNAGLANNLQKLINETLDTITGGMMANTHLNDSIKSRHPGTFGTPTDWEKLHFSGTYAMTQMELSRIKAYVADVESLAVSQILDYANQGCVVHFDRHWGMAVARTNYLYPGDRFEAAVLFAQQPDTCDYKVVGIELGGQKLTSVNGVATYTTVATVSGLHRVDGKVTVRDPVGTIRGYDVRVDYMVEQPLAVIRVDSVQMISAGVPTAISVKVIGAEIKDIIVTASGGTLNGSNGKYLLTAHDPERVIVRVSRKNIGGKILPIDSTIFFVKPR